MARKIAKKPRWRASWKGNMQFGLVSLAVEAVNARSPEEGDIHFHQLHAECHQRIHYDKVCPIHGPVEQSEIVPGYEYQRGKYVEIQPEELDALRSENEKSYVIDSFIEYEELNPIYLDGRMYYLIPGNAEAGEAYQVLVTALDKENRWGIGHLVMSGKDQIAAVKTEGRVLLMAMLNYKSELRPSRDFEQAHGKLPSRQVALAVDLIESWSEKKFDFAAYEDRYRNRLTDLIEKKISGDETVDPEPDNNEEVPVINLMDALKRSLKQRTKHVNSKKRKSKPKKAVRKKLA